jgi:hypothetical protein
MICFVLPFGFSLSVCTFDEQNVAKDNRNEGND